MCRGGREFCLIVRVVCYLLVPSATPPQLCLRVSPEQLARIATWACWANSPCCISIGAQPRNCGAIVKLLLHERIRYTKYPSTIWTRCSRNPTSCNVAMRFASLWLANCSYLEVLLKIDSRIDSAARSHVRTAPMLLVRQCMVLNRESTASRTYLNS